MTHTHLRGLVVLTLLCFGCHRSDGVHPGMADVERDAAASTQAPSHQDGPRAPAVVRWVRLEEDATRLRLLAEVVKQTPFASALSVTVHVPEGLRLVSGTPTWEVPADAAPGVHSRELTFTRVGTPGEPLSLTADARGAGFGVHATATYRVAGSDKSLTSGAESQEPMPRPTGPSIRVGNTDYGRSVPSP